MRWVLEEEIFREIAAQAHKCVFIDSGRSSTQLRRFIFDDAELLSTEFATLIQNLLAASKDQQAYFLVLSPDPETYFYRHFKKYPLLEIARGDSPKEYIAAMNESPGTSSADALGINSFASVIVPLSGRWFAHLLRSADDNGGHLWIPPDWAPTITAHYPYLRT
jgi:hypothetical protein